MDAPLSASRYSNEDRSRSRSPRKRGQGNHRNNRRGRGGGGGRDGRGRQQQPQNGRGGGPRNDGRDFGRPGDDRGGFCDDGYYGGGEPNRGDSRDHAGPRFRDDNRRDDLGRAPDMKSDHRQNHGQYDHHGPLPQGRENFGRDELHGRNGERDNGHGGGGDFRGRNDQNHGHYGPSRGHDNNSHGVGDNRNNTGPPLQDEDKSHSSGKCGEGKQSKRGPPTEKFDSKYPTYKINPNALPDEKLNDLTQPTRENEDPRGDDPTKRITKKAKIMGAARNTESFDPASTLVRPDLRVMVGSKDKKVLDNELKHDDVVIVPELFGSEENWDLYYKLVEEIRSLQNSNVHNSEWVSWHEGAHLIVKNNNLSKLSPTFEGIIDRLCEYFNIRKKSIGTRFNWYRDSSDWKPFHHDSAAYNPDRAKSQNITVGVSFGARRELAFMHATPQGSGEKVKIYFPQTNNGVFSFGRDVNILWKHGVNALPEEEQDGKGRISIILWGLVDGVKEEDGSPPLLGSDGKGPHAQRQDRGRRGNNRNGNNHGRGGGNNRGNHHGRSFNRGNNHGRGNNREKGHGGGNNHAANREGGKN